MAYSSLDMEDLISGLSNITKVVQAADELDITNPDNVTAAEKARLLLNLANKQTRKIDPVIEKQRQKLPIFKKKNELIEVSIKIGLYLCNIT